MNPQEAAATKLNKNLAKYKKKIVVESQIKLLIEIVF